MARRSLILLTSALMPLFLTLVWWQVRLSQSRQPAPDAASVGEQALLSFIDHTERVRDPAGKLTWSFQTDRLDLTATGDYLLYGLKQARKLRDDVAVVEFHADRARIDQRTYDVAAQGNVVATSERGVSFQSDAAYWFETDGKLFVPKVADLRWQDPANPKAELATIQTTRLFYWPDSTHLDLPDALTATRGTDTVQAAAGSALVDRGELLLRGPATVTADAPANLTAGETGGPKRRITVACAAGGQIAYDRRTGAARSSGGTTVDLPGDSVRISCDDADYSGTVERRVSAKGNMVMSDPSNRLTAPHAQVDTIGRRAEFGGPVNLLHSGLEGAVSLSAQRLVYHYREGGKSAEAWGQVVLDTNDATTRAPHLSTDLERERATLTDGVHLTTKPHNPVVAATADEEAQARALPVELTAERLVHNFRRGDRWSEATGHPRFKQADREGTAEFLRFNHETEVVFLDRQVRLWNKQGERARCGRLTYDTRRDELKIEQADSAEFLLRGEAKELGR